MNSLLDEIHAALLIQRLKYLKTWTHRRRSIANKYSHEIHNELISLMPLPENPDQHVHHLFVINTTLRYDLQKYLLSQGVNTLIHYPVPCHQQKSLGPHRIVEGGLQETEKHSRTCLSLPIHPYLTDSEVNYVIHTCNAYHAEVYVTL